MKTSLRLNSAVSRVSRFGMAGMLMAFAGIALLGVSRPAYAFPATFTYVGTDNTGITFSAYENSGTQIESNITITIPAALQAEFTHPQDYIIIDSITPVGFTSVNGDLDDVATNLQYISGTAIIGTTQLSATGSDTVTISWLPVDLSGINDGEFGLWQGTFEVDFTFYGYPTGYPYKTGGVINPPEAYPDTYYEDVTFDAQVNDTPEPGSMLLFGSGLLGMAGMLRRKFRRG
ncbi:MAG: PEP-CTERM sorting domain-containing protein [Terracidiphilus sp.]